MVKIGTILIHPVHGEMTITAIKSGGDEEYIEGKWREGRIIRARFNKFIPAIKWREGKGKNTVSVLIFHEYYLAKLEVKKDGA